MLGPQVVRRAAVALAGRTVVVLAAVVALVALCSASAGCTAVLGIDDVALQSSGPAPDGGGNPGCKIASHFAQVTASPATSMVSHADDGGATLFIDLNDDAKPDSLFLELRDGGGGHGVLNGNGTYSLIAGDTALGTCGICVIVSADYDSMTQSTAQTYVPRAMGDLQINTASATQLVGAMHGLVLRHVNLDTNSGTTTDVNDGCTVQIDEVDFNMTYGSTVRRAAPGTLGAQRAAAASRLVRP
ncbi:MAG TPA: hypothetical protein VH165_09335 [Kofleriaceae bacterium]|jgi:hypothetical protein|nr:hypothetical protein [Kofleriaceae bacterium]